MNHLWQLWSRRPIGFVLALALAVRVVLLIFAVWGSENFVAPEHFSHQTADMRGYDFTPQQAVDAWVRWDSVWYVGISKNGYRANDPRDAAFFPLFPLTIRALSDVTTLPNYVSALLVANAFDVLGWVWLALLARRRFAGEGERGLVVALWAVVGFALFPTRNFEFSGYTEGMFLAASVGAFLAYERQWYGLAALGAACASATRPQGVLVVGALIADALLSGRSERWRQAGVLLLGLAGLALYMAYLGYAFADPLRFTAAQDYWHRGFGNPLRVFLSGGEPLWYLALLLALMLCVSMLRHPAPWRDRVFCVASLLVPMMSGSMMSMSRFVGVVFPLFIFAAGRGPSAVWRWTYAIIAALFACYMAYRLGQGDLVI